MPIYEYKCDKCGKTFEVLQKFSDEPLKTHADCGGNVERLVSLSGFQLKGGGWYVTDYGKGGSKPAEKSSDKSGDKAESKSDSKSESKSETKSESKTESKSESKSSSDSSPAAKS